MFAALAKYVSIGLEIEEFVTGKIYIKSSTSLTAMNKTPL